MKPLRMHVYTGIIALLTVILIQPVRAQETASPSVSAPTVSGETPITNNPIPSLSDITVMPDNAPVQTALPDLSTTPGGGISISEGPGNGNPVTTVEQPSGIVKDTLSVNKRLTREQRVRERQKKEAELQHQIEQLRNETASDLGLEPTSWSEKLDWVLGRIAGTLTKNFRDDKNPLTLSMILIAFGVVFLGLLISRTIASWVRRTLFSHVKDMNEHATIAVEKIFYYFLVVSFVVIGLQIAGIPLTTFTFLGGAVAIGVGFGAQNLINNFISGLIVLIERPIKLNDIVEVDGECGRVVNIGARCSQIHLAKGIDVILPNSAFLEKKVVNWTLSDQRVRYAVRAGVTAKTPARDAADLMEKAIAEQTLVLKTPVPKVLLIESGENEFVFEAYFWVNITSTLDGRVICSDIRYRIDALFREAGMTSAPIAAIRDAKSPVG